MDLCLWFRCLWLICLWFRCLWFRYMWFRCLFFHISMFKCLSVYKCIGQNTLLSKAFKTISAPPPSLFLFLSISLSIYMCVCVYVWVCVCVCVGVSASMCSDCSIKFANFVAYMLKWLFHSKIFAVVKWPSLPKKQDHILLNISNEFVPEWGPRHSSQWHSA